MPFDILEIGHGSDLTVIRRTLLDLSEPAVRESAAAIADSAVWIVPPTIRESLAKLSGLVEDRGVKRREIELSRLLLKGGGNVIPLIEAGYSSAGKLRAGVRAFLEHAADRPLSLFIVAVSDDLFDQLRRKAKDPDIRPGPLPPFRGPSGAVLNLLDWLPEPPELREAFLGESTEAYAVRQLILRAAKVDDTGLITGDTGTGKEIVASQIHKQSERGKISPFRAVNCGAFPPDLLEAELFGRAKGIYTGADTTTEGLWVSAKGGSLFLDEIGELSPTHQVKILRALQEKKIRKVGGIEEVTVDARVICATNRDLFAMVQAGQFREDLYYRLRGFLIATPPLRDHRDDVRLLARALWKRITHDQGAILAEEIVSDLCAYAWPGNVRELKTFLTQLFGLFGRGDKPLGSQHVQAVFEMQGVHPDAGSSQTATAPVPAERQEQWSAFRRLREGYETVRAIEHWLSPLLNGDDPDAQQSLLISTEIGKLLNELDRHSRIPRRFTHRTFDRLSLLRSRLDYFLSEYQTSPDAAVASLRNGIRQVLDETVTDILADIDRALAGTL